MFRSAANHGHRVASLTMLLALLLLSGCATVQNNHDPIEGLNRKTDAFNDGLDRISLKPLARGYVAAIDPNARKAISNFYDNAAYPNTIINDLLQGKGTQGVEDILRFVINSTFGIGGLFDMASHMRLKKHNEDLGQTLAVWGFSQGAYIVYPFFGPSSVRDTPNLVAETAVSGLFWASFVLGPGATIPLSIFNYIDKRSRLLDASDMRDELALDPYIFTRESWRQNREYLIYDGHPPAKPPMNGADNGKADDDGWEDAPAIEKQ